MKGSGTDTVPHVVSCFDYHAGDPKQLLQRRINHSKHIVAGHVRRGSGFIDIHWRHHRDRREYRRLETQRSNWLGINRNGWLPLKVQRLHGYFVDLVQELWLMQL